MLKIKLLIVLLIIAKASVLAQVEKPVEIKLIYNGYFDNGIHYKMPVLIELRDGESLLESEIISQKTGIINSDGKVVIDFADVEDGNYWLVARAGGFMPVAIPDKQSLSSAGIEYDFTTSSDKSVGGESVLYFSDNKWQIRGGDLDGNLSVGAFDVNKFIPQIGNSVSGSIPANDNIAIEYETVVINNQEWMQKNLDVAYYRNGDEILHAETVFDWEQAWENEIGAWCYYDNDESNGETYGKLYNWYAVNDERGLAPAGWRVPSDDEWKELEIELGMSQEQADDVDWRGTNQGAKLAGGYNLWINGILRNNSEFNSSGFSSFPGGSRNQHGSFDQAMGWQGYWWTSTEQEVDWAWMRGLQYYNLRVDRNNYLKGSGFSVRCVRDVE